MKYPDYKIPSFCTELTFPVTKSRFERQTPNASRPLTIVDVDSTVAVESLDTLVIVDFLKGLKRRKAAEPKAAGASQQKALAKAIISLNPGFILL